MNDILTTAKAALEKHRAEIIVHEQAFSEVTLPGRVKIGLHCLRAYQVFILQDPGKRNKSGKNQHSKGGLVTRDVASTPQGFEGWLATECPWLKKPTAYKYMTALKGLGLSETSTEEDVDDAVRQSLRIGPVTIKSLTDAATELIAPPAPEPQTLQQSEFDFLCDHLRDFRIQGETIRAMKCQLDANPGLLRVASARAYNILYDLTGTHWKPCDEAADLALVDPDSLAL